LIIASPPASLLWSQRRRRTRKHSRRETAFVARAVVDQDCEDDCALDWDNLPDEEPPEPEPAPVVTPAVAVAHVETVTDFRETLREAETPVVAMWSALWCRKCIGLKPRFAELSAEFGDLRFVNVDVNSVPRDVVQDLAGVTQMPTFQLWLDESKPAKQVIGTDEPDAVVARIRRELLE